MSIPGDIMSTPGDTLSITEVFSTPEGCHQYTGDTMKSEEKS